MQFYAEHLAQFPNPAEIEARKLAAEYHESTEAFDRTVCTGPIVHGAIQPANYYEYSRIAEYARSERRRALEQAERLGISRAELHNAICDYRFNV